MKARWGALAALAAIVVAQTGCLYWGFREQGESRVVEADAMPKAVFVLRVNAGMAQPYTDQAGNTWQADQLMTEDGSYGFTGTMTDTVDRGTDVAIEGTSDPRIYQTERWSMDGFKAKVPNGTYTVRLHFAETYPDIGIDGPRVFDVSVEGQTVLKDFNLSEVAGGQRRAYVKTCRGVEVADGVLDIEFARNSQNPEINGIEIISE
jgi:hypothetical protein